MSLKFSPKVLYFIFNNIAVTSAMFIGDKLLRNNLLVCFDCDSKSLMGNFIATVVVCVPCVRHAEHKACLHTRCLCFVERLLCLTVLS